MTIVLLTVVIAVLSATIASIAAVYLVRKPLKSINAGVKQFTQSRLDHRIPVRGSGKLDQLAQNLNEMAEDLEKKITAIAAQRNELEAVFSSMTESVVVMDGRHQIIAINKAAASLLTINAETAIGRGIQEMIYNPELQQLIGEVASQKRTIEKDIVIYKDKKRYLQVRGTPVDTARGGAVIVLSDMTRLYQLENIRREFVSNVSHELKTPITSIMGAVETLLDGATDNPVESKKFLEIIAKHTDRLGAIIEDLLNLSRIEQEIESHYVTMEIGSIKDVLMTAMATCQAKAGEKDINITIDCDQTLTAPINAPLLEQAIVNLVDNAIKYSDPQKHICLHAKRGNDTTTINVIDEGYGIAEEHLPRIFERFYVADKARSRKLGGTGLGLAIVKHIVSAHNGKVSVESQLGKGSTFTITLPAA